MTRFRTAARVVLLDEQGRVLLFEGRDLSDDGDQIRFWFTAGGGVEEGESVADAAAREVREETGQHALRIVGPFHRREVDFFDHGHPTHQVEHFFAARTSDVTVSHRGWTELETRAVTTWRWWTADELLAEGVRYFPDDLVQLVQQAGGLV